MNEQHQPSPHCVRWSSLVRAGGSVLDVAAGGGRHSQWFLQRGHQVTAVDRDVAALRELAAKWPRLEVVEADLEGAPWPFAGRTFDAVVVCNYLWRPLLPDIVSCVATGGVLMYETFAIGNERFGRPRNPDFLLQPGELLAAVRSAFEVRDYVHGEVGDPPNAVRQRVCAVRTAD